MARCDRVQPQLLTALLGAASVACAASAVSDPVADATVPQEPDATGDLVDASTAPRPDAEEYEGPPMYAHTARTLFVVDKVSFDLRTIGDFDNGNDSITDMAVTPDGNLYGISMTRLYEIDRDNALATYIGDVPGSSNVGMTFLPDGTLLATDKAGGVRQIEPRTGAVTEIGAFGGGYETAGDLVAVADGTMYAISDAGPNGDEATNNVLITVDTSTGVATPVGQINYGRVYGCAYANGHVYAFTDNGEIIEIDRNTGAGTLVRTHAEAFYGAGVTPMVVVD